jgi:hypothetical protein
MIYHIAIGDIAGNALKEAVNLESTLAGEVVVLKDILHVGPLKKGEGQSFSELRSAYWQEVAPNTKEPIQVDDMERLLEVSKAMYDDEDAVAWLWMAPWPADVCAYHWVLPYLSKHAGRFYLLNIAGLPFLDENGKVYYPKSIGEILPKELVKARRLARQVTPAEVEVDGEEWQKLVEENTGIRTHEGGKKLTSRAEDHYDKQLVSFCSHQFQKASRIVAQALNKYNIPTGDVHLGWRLKKIAEAGQLLLQGDVSKALKDFEVKLPGGEENEAANAPAEVAQNQS